METALATTLTLRRGTVKRLHVDRGIMNSNRKNGTYNPAITVQTTKGTYKAYRVDIRGTSQFVQPTKKLSCGARAWIVTRSEVILFFEPDNV